MNRDAESTNKGPRSDRRSEDATLIHEWAQAEGRFPTTPEVVDETLRDGLQSPSAKDPPLGDKLAMIHRMAKVGIQAVNLGLPGAHRRQFEDALALAREIAGQSLPLSPHCAARTRISDIEPVVELSQRAGMAVEVGVFVGSSPIRAYAEAWTLDDLKRWTEESVSFAVAEGLPVMYVTEDSTRSTPETLRELYTTALRCGATRLCVTDTVGCATPFSADAIVRFVRKLIDEVGTPTVTVDWHGHRDRGLDVANSLAAWGAGAKRCHGTALGIGERCGNAPIELLLVNLHLRGYGGYALHLLADYVEFAARALGVAVPPGQPLVGADAFRTATGTHAAAVVKAERRGDAWLAERVYSCIPASLLGREQSIEIGPMSGEANVTHYLDRRGIRRTDDVVKRILHRAKSGERVLLDREIEAIVDGSGSAGQKGRSTSILAPTVSGSALKYAGRALRVRRLGGGQVR